METTNKTVRERLTALIATGALAASMLAMPLAAYAAQPAVTADDATASAGAQTGTGATALNMVVKSNSEYTETDTNIAFTFPSAINYVVSADGTLTGPSADAAYIQSQSNMPIHVAAADLDPTTATGNTWNFYDTADKVTSESTDNNVFLKLGPTDNQINLAKYAGKAYMKDDSDVATKSSWDMNAKEAKIGLNSTGQAGKISNDITSQKQFGTITWYVKAGTTPTA